MASLFGITAADVVAKLLPSGGSDFLFSVGAGGDMSEALCLEIVEAKEAEVESYLPERYQRLLRRVEGEVAVKWASEGQTTAAVSLLPVTVVRGVYLNYPRTRAFPDRRPGEAMAADEYSVDLSTGVITLVEALDEEDRLYVDYEHGAASGMLDLRELALTLAAVEVSRRLSYFQSAEGADRVEAWQLSAAGRLRDIADGRVHVPRLERLELVNETRMMSLGRL